MAHDVRRRGRATPRESFFPPAGTGPATRGTPRGSAAPSCPRPSLHKFSATPPAPAASRPKRDVPAASPSRAPAAPKKPRGAAAVQAALAAAAPPITAENYATYALAAANPHPPST